MKKLFALLSTFVLTLAFVGLATKAPVASAADDKWTVDPTLAEDEIPMYEMGSIYTTFPNYYDNAAKPDELWGGSSRMYPWNETRLRVAQYDETGAATGKYYAIYFSGLTSATNSDGSPASGAGNNVNGYAKKDDGTITTVRVKVNNGGYTYDATPADPSLSHLRVNFTGEDIAVDMVELSNKIGDGSNAMNMYNRMFVFDGEGRIVRGVATDSFYLKAGSDGAAADVWAPQFCYVDGVVTPVAEGVECDKEMKEVVDADGNPVYDEQGNPTYEETGDLAYVYKRFMWEFFETKPENVNTAGYLLAGWDCDLWDLCFEVEGGYMAIAFLNGEGTNHKIKDVEREVTNATREAAGQEKLAEGDHLRECVREIRIPANGGTFDFGYLDKGVVTELTKFNNIIRGAYMSGRNVKSAEVRTYNFSSKPLTTFDKVVAGHSYQLMDGKNYVEVLKGQSFQPANNVIYEGLASLWTVENDVTSYAKDLNGLEYSMYVDGTMVVYKYPYADKEEMVADFLNDLTHFMEDVRGDATYGYSEGKKAVTLDDLYPTGALNWELISTSANSEVFWGSAAMRTKWAWMVNYVAAVRGASGLSTSYWETIDQGLTASPGTFNCEIAMFLRGEHRTSWPASSDYTNEENANGFLPKESNQSAFLNYTIDTTSDHVDQIHVVKFVVKNSAGLENEITLNYVVVDEYTPIIEVNKDALYINPVIEAEKVVINPIDPMVFAKAYNGRYNGSSIKGDDISQNIHFSSETLDFNAPTEGKHVVKAVVYNDAKHYAETSFTVEIYDITAPYVEFYSGLVLPYGTTWSPELTVKKAVDAVDGNLLASTIEWCIDESSNPVNTSKAGKYKVTVSVYDASGNFVSMPKAINVEVLEKGATAKDVVDALAALEGKVDLVAADLLSILDAVESNGKEIAAVKALVAALPSDADIKAVADAVAALPQTSDIEVLTAAISKLGTKADIEELAADIEELTAAIAELPAGSDVEEIKAAIAELPNDADIADVKAAIAGVSTSVADVNTVVSAKGCGKSAHFVQFLAAGCLLVFLLRKKH